MIIVKTTPKNLIFALVRIMATKDKKNSYNKALIFALEKLKNYIFSDYSVLTRKKFLEILDFFYDRIGDEKIKKMGKYKFYKKYFKYLLKKGEINFVSGNEKLQEYEIVICFFANRYLLISKNFNFNEFNF